MTPAIAQEELLAWNHEAAEFWKAQGRGPRAFPLPAQLGATRLAGQRGRLPAGIQGRPAPQLGVAVSTVAV